jgi:hypothetical protein
MPQTLWQFLGYALLLVVEKVLGDWARTLQLWLLGVLPILVIFGAAALVVYALRPSPQSWGVVAGSILTATVGIPATRRTIRRLRSRRLGRISRAAPRSGDGTPRREGR